VQVLQPVSDHQKSSLFERTPVAGRHHPRRRRESSVNHHRFQTV